MGRNQQRHGRDRWGRAGRRQPSSLQSGLARAGEEPHLDRLQAVQIVGRCETGVGCRVSGFGFGGSFRIHVSAYGFSFEGWGFGFSLRAGVSGFRLQAEFEV